MAHVQCPPVGLGIDGHGAQAELTAGAQDSNCDLPPVGDQYLMKHFGISVTVTLSIDVLSLRSSPFPVYDPMQTGAPATRPAPATACTAHDH